MRIVERFSERERTRIALIWGLGLFLLYTLVIAPFFAAQRTAAEEQGSFIRTVERLARQNNVALAHFAPQPPVHMEEIVVRSIEIKMRGSYFDLLSFLHAVQEAEPGIRFGDFSVTADGDALDIAVRMETATSVMKKKQE